jgi:hypothetical protein
MFLADLLPSTMDDSFKKNIFWQERNILEGKKENITTDTERQ